MAETEIAQTNQHRGQSGGPRGVTEADIENWFTYHPPTEEQKVRYENLRAGFRDMALTILASTPSCADQTAALRKLRETSMAVNQTIACNESEVEPNQ